MKNFTEEEKSSIKRTEENHNSLWTLINNGIYHEDFGNDIEDKMEKWFIKKLKKLKEYKSIEEEYDGDIENYGWFMLIDELSISILRKIGIQKIEQKYNEILVENLHY